MKKLLGILVLGLLLCSNAYPVTLSELENPKKSWYEKNPISKYLKKRKECKDYADKSDTVYLGKQNYKYCMDNR